jgi:hypothetical protein
MRRGNAARESRRGPPTRVQPVPFIRRMVAADADQRRDFGLARIVPGETRDGNGEAEQRSP